MNFEPGVEVRDFKWLLDVKHPLGNHWIATPYEFGDHFYLGYSIKVGFSIFDMSHLSLINLTVGFRCQCDGTIIPDEDRDERALLLGKKISYFYGGHGSG